MRRLLSILAAALVLPLTACGDDDGPSGPTFEASGTYNLATINGENPPVVVAQVDADFIEITAGVIELNADNTFRDSTTYRISEGGAVRTEADVFTGTYAQTGNAVTLTLADGGAYALSVSEDALTQTVAQFVLVYRK